MQRGRQIPIPLSHPPAYDRDSYLIGDANREAAELVLSWPQWSAPVMLLCGPPGSGKTHLARLWAEAADARLVGAGDLGGQGVAVGGNLGVENVAAEAVPERELFHLINRAREEGFFVLITSRSPLADWRLTLKDTVSRLRLAVPVGLGEPDEELLRQVLVKLFADRQLEVERAVVDYILVRMERSLSAAQALVAAIDEAALSEGRRITRPLAARVLSDQPESQQEEL
ncbi:HdaA/DnaA family protein [Afifella pfennigii]|uniref:HdaA/DnaA family protein n=1 Tax=Afifella pfennigii TaxID=209897 RepID=UPI000556BE37|nr:hypothetical protein [Afifella pfennigii]